jgi:hypothetical protein
MNSKHYCWNSSVSQRSPCASWADSGWPAAQSRSWVCNSKPRSRSSPNGALSPVQSALADWKGMVDRVARSIPLDDHSTRHMRNVFIRATFRSADGVSVRSSRRARIRRTAGLPSRLRPALPERVRRCRCRLSRRSGFAGQCPGAWCRRLYTRRSHSLAWPTQTGLLPYFDAMEVTADHGVCLESDRSML